MDEELKNIAVQLFEIDALRFGNFETHAAGILTPVWFDLRVIISHPQLMKSVSSTLWKFAGKNSKDVSKICGVPYTALPIATLISVEADVPMLMKRKEAKAYGTKKLIEGQFSKGDTCVIIEDVVVTGISVLRTAKDLIDEGLKVEETLVILDREQGGRKNLEENGIQMKSLFTLTGLMECLVEAGKITPIMVQDVKDYMQRDQEMLDNYIKEKSPRLNIS
ncbi:uridine 5'-monophosphate synthase [Neodiprion lecontei]|uniref:orotate phosphoribosyltransferase n=1 Tax=Neodiprion lecontei TaxID=441921 RepID=A0A6J0C385_NEOLC|nr:uridine 5'-monophosphate synthase [Neodiprion lecontei]